MALRALLRQGIGDTIIQVAATTLVRLGLVLAVLLLAPFVSLEEVGRFDLFVIGATFVQLAVTVGMDSGLAIVNHRKNTRMRRWFLILALMTLSLLAALCFMALEVVLLVTQDLRDHAPLMRMAVGYGSSLGAMILIFSWFRWQSRARTASLLLVIANAASFALATLCFFLFGTITSFVAGLLVGSVGGYVLCLLYMIRNEGFSAGDIREIAGRKLLAPVAIDLLRLSLPYLIASVSLILRRLVDRAYILTWGDPALVGAYAIVARSAETIAFAFSIPSVGFAPILVARYREDSVKRLGRLMYVGYVALSSLVVLLASFAAPAYFAAVDNAAINLIVPIALCIIAGTLFLGETSIAAFGYVLARKPALFTVFSIVFILCYAAGVAVLAAMGFGVAALGWSFVVSSFLFSTAAVVWSEKLSPFGYPMPVVFTFKITTLLISTWPLFA